MATEEAGDKRSKARPRAGLVTKLALTLVVAGAPGLVGLSFINFQSEEELLKETLVNERLEEITLAKVQAVEQTLRIAASDARLLATLFSVEELSAGLVTGDPEARSKCVPKVVHDFRRLAESRGIYYQLDFISTDGDCVVRVLHEDGVTRVERDPHAEPGLMQIAREIEPGDLWVGRASLNRIEGEVERPIRPIVSYLCAVRGPTGETGGLTMLKVEMGPILSRMVAGVPWVKTMVVDSSGYYVAHSEREKEWGRPEDLGGADRIQNDLPTPVLETLLTPAGGSASHEGSTYVSLPVRPPGGPAAAMLIVTATRDSELMGSDLQAVRQRVLLLAAASFLLPLLAGLVLVAYFLRPVPKLQAAARAVAGGDLSHRVDIRSGDEMQELAEDFNDMAARLEEYGRLERTLELEKLRDDLIHMIVHDLRTPLTSIISSLKTIERAEADPELTRQLLPYCVNAGNSLMNMINDLLDINKMEAGALELYPEPVDVGEVVADALEVLRGLAAESSIRLEHSVDDDVDLISADHDKVERIIINLVGNGIKFTPSGGEVRVRVSRDDSTGGAHIQVIDTGAGIPEEHRKRIFDKFGQVESRRSGRLVSTGLGLTFCKLAVEAHGGRIWVESEVGEGSMFHVVLPPVPACELPRPDAD
ncbi:MAG: HAMP domain-containing protein [Armatimonadia bacterium]|nr:HAMP domain-containing protein [Armatimonadia bacterium]